MIYNNCFNLILCNVFYYVIVFDYWDVKILKYYVVFGCRNLGGIYIMNFYNKVEKFLIFFFLKFLIIKIYYIV